MGDKSSPGVRPCSKGTLLLEGGRPCPTPQTRGQASVDLDQPTPETGACPDLCSQPPSLMKPNLPLWGEGVHTQPGGKEPSVCTNVCPLCPRGQTDIAWSPEGSIWVCRSGGVSSPSHGGRGRAMFKATSGDGKRLGGRYCLEFN